MEAGRFKVPEELILFGCCGEIIHADWALQQHHQERNYRECEG